MPNSSPVRGEAVTGRIGGFRLKTLLGKGGMAEVYLATQVAMDRDVALKIVPQQPGADEKYVQRFLNEIRLAAQLKHPNIVTAFEAGQDAGYYFLAQAYVDGESLRERLDRCGPLDEKQALLITRKIADALDYAWREQRLLHRDVKPSNILLDSAGEPKLMDFGLSKSLADNPNLTVRTTAIGTPNYMSPELVQARKDADFRADLYSLGATLYHMLTGKMPFKSADLVETLRRQVMEPLPDPRGYNRKITDACASLLQVMLAKDPADRYASWADLIDDIDRVLQGLPAAGPAGGPPGATPEPGRKPAPRASRRTWILAGAVTAGAVLAALLAGFSLAGHRERSAQQRNDARLQAAIRRLKAENNLPDLRHWADVSDEGIRLDLSDNPSLRELGPLQGLPLVALDAANTAAYDLAPLRGMPLRELTLRGTRVDDLSSLIGMPLLRLNLSGCPYVKDLTPLRDLPLTRLDIASTPVADLRPLSRMPLAELSLADTAAADLSPLRNLPLKVLTIAGTPVTDLAPIARARLERLDMARTHAASLAPLTGMPLVELDVSDCYLVQDFTPLAGAPLRRLRAVGLRTSALRGIRGQSLEDVNLWQSRVSDLSALRGAAVSRLDLAECGYVSDLAPLAGLPLRWVNLWRTRVQDLEPLRGAPIEHLDLAECGSVTNLAPLAGMPLTWVNLSGCPRITSVAPLGRSPLEQVDLRRCEALADITPLLSVPSLTNALVDAPHLQNVRRRVEELKAAGNRKDASRLARAFQIGPG